MFTNSISPALQAHLDARLDFVTELSRKMFDTALRVNELNMRLAQELLEEAASANQRTFACVQRHFVCEPATGRATAASNQAQLDCITDLGE